MRSFFHAKNWKIMIVIFLRLKSGCKQDVRWEYDESFERSKEGARQQRQWSSLEHFSNNLLTFLNLLKRDEHSSHSSYSYARERNPFISSFSFSFTLSLAKSSSARTYYGFVPQKPFKLLVSKGEECLFNLSTQAWGRRCRLPFIVSSALSSYVNYSIASPPSTPIHSNLASFISSNISVALLLITIVCLSSS